MTKVAPLSIKSFGDFADILASGTPDVWESHRPAQGGAAGKLLSKVIAQAAALREKTKTKPKRKAKARR